MGNGRLLNNAMDSNLRMTKGQMGSALWTNMCIVAQTLKAVEANHESH
jgi:hypothetical protein